MSPEPALTWASVCCAPSGCAPGSTSPTGTALPTCPRSRSRDPTSPACARSSTGLSIRASNQRKWRTTSSTRSARGASTSSRTRRRSKPSGSPSPGSRAEVFARDKAQTDPDQAAFVMATSGPTVTFGEFEARSNRMAHLYREVGLQRGDHVAFFMENNPRMLECEGGAERTGLYYTCINSYLAPAEAAYIVNDCQARVVVSSAAMAPVAKELPALCPKVERWLLVDAKDAAEPWEPY